MNKTFEIIPAHALVSGTVVTGKGVIFSAVFRCCASCGIILYNLQTSEKRIIPFNDEFRQGALYSVFIKGLKPAEWGYRYFRDSVSFIDPSAHELTEIQDGKEDGKTITVSRLFKSSEDNLSISSVSRKPWADRIIYTMHVKGFTASRTSGVRAKGTYKGVIEKIPYLKELGVTAVELMPVYELLPVTITMTDDSLDSADQTGNDSGQPAHVSSRPLVKECCTVNYWNFGEGCYFAPKKAYSRSSEPQKEFALMVNALHEAGLEVFLQLFFADKTPPHVQLSTCKFYVTHYGIDGFHIKGNASSLDLLISTPILADTAILYYNFPYDSLKSDEGRQSTEGIFSVSNLCEYTDYFQTLARKTVKGDDFVLRELVRNLVSVPVEHGSVHYTANYEGFTLMDLVSYNQKHNEENGEDNRDGENNNLSWNCGVEGKTNKKDIRALRLRQIKNFMTLNFLAQGTPLIWAGDERGNSQGGNNNPYCQDNETGWTNWKLNADSSQILEFTKNMIAFRKAHGIFRKKTNFRFTDYKVNGYPDISFHGREAWKPELESNLNAVGILYNEAYADDEPADSLIYVAVNMNWKDVSLGLPKTPAGYEWKVLVDTSETESFLMEPIPVEGKQIDLSNRSIKVLKAVANE